MLHEYKVPVNMSEEQLSTLQSMIAHEISSVEQEILSLEEKAANLGLTKLSLQSWLYEVNAAKETMATHATESMRNMFSHMGQPGTTEVTDQVSELLAIGPKKAQLLRAVGIETVQDIINSDVDDLACIEGIGMKLAMKLKWEATAIEALRKQTDDIATNNKEE